MKTNDKTLDKLITGRIKNLGLEEPSADFTFKVMQSIASEPSVYVVKQRNYRWVWALVPILIGFAWYSLVFFELTGYISRLWATIISTTQTYVTSLIPMMDQFRHLSIPPFLLIGFIAILTLLTIEELISRPKHTL